MVNVPDSYVKCPFCFLLKRNKRNKRKTIEKQSLMPGLQNPIPRTKEKRNADKGKAVRVIFCAL
jgi:hypothetical protein